MARFWVIFLGVEIYTRYKYRQILIMRLVKFQNLNVSRLVLELSLPNPLKPGVRSRMKM